MLFQNLERNLKNVDITFNFGELHPTKYIIFSEIFLFYVHNENHFCKMHIFN